MKTLGEILDLISSDLHLGESDKQEFENLFAQLLTLNVMLEIPEEYRDGVDAMIAGNVLNDQNTVIQKLNDIGIGQDLSQRIVEDSIKKSLSEVLQKYDDTLSPAVKIELQNSLT